MKDKTVIAFFIKFQKPYYLKAILIAMLLIINVLLKLPVPLLTKHLIDIVIPLKQAYQINLICFILFTIIVFNQGVAYWNSILLIKYKVIVQFEIDKQLYEHLQRLPLDYFIKNRVGYVMSRISELHSSDLLMVDSIVDLVRDAITFIFGSYFILSFSKTIGVVALAILPFYTWGMKLFNKKLKKTSEIINERGAIYRGELERNLSAIEKIKTSTIEDLTSQRLLKKLWNIFYIEIIRNRIQARSHLLLGGISILTPFFILWYGCMEIISNNLTIGEFIAINSFLGYLYNPVQRITGFGYQYATSIASLKRVYSLFREHEEPQGGENLDRITNIELKNLTFRYENRTIFKNIELKIEGGDKILIQGENGTGKSTITKIILGLHQPEFGDVIISGKNIKDLNLISLRKRICYISQTKNLIDMDTLNRFKQLKKQKNNLLQELKLNDLDVQKRHSLQKTFSGGETQKADILEAFTKDFDLLILDEALSNIESGSEEYILKKLFYFNKDKTIIYITHGNVGTELFKKRYQVKNGNITLL